MIGFITKFVKKTKAVFTLVKRLYKDGKLHLLEDSSLCEDREQLEVLFAEYGIEI